MTSDEIYKLIEANGLTLHGDIEHFADLVASAEREACARVCDEIYFQNYPDAEKWERSEEGEAIRKRSHV